MKISEAQKTDVLLAALAERYEAQRTIRERVQTVGLAAIGLLLAAGGWLIQSGETFDCVEKGVAVAGLLGALAALRFGYLANLQRGFRSQQQVAVKIETALGLHTAGAFDSSDTPIYPESWSKAGAVEGPGAFFKTTHLLLYVGALFLITTIIFVA